ncbi:MAG: small, acid-soluble spore protein, alpha/beta type [Bacilli bacterium]
MNNKKKALDSMKYEIARQNNVSLGANTTARDNGKVGGEMTKKLTDLGKAQMGLNTNSNK